MTGATQHAAAALPTRPARALVCAAADAELPPWVNAAAAANGLTLVRVPDVADALNSVRRGRPPLLVIDARASAETTGRAVLTALKADSYTAVVPCLAITDSAGPQLVSLLDDGADEVLAADGDAAEALARVAAALRRSVRDLSAQPTTRLPAAGAIEGEIERRIAAGVAFAACYADLDHFKEFNDRYGYHEGDRVIRMVGRILHDAAVGCAGREAFVGHVGGDDFMLVLPLDRAGEVCTLALEVFDAFVPLQYSEADRRVGYYFGKDRRGQLHRVPLMTLSIGVATTAHRSFRSAAEVSKLASEMKSFAKAKPGSLFAVDRRRDDGTAGTTGSASRAPGYHAPHTSRP
jgi:diguanylate cyclase (GGDEF)-like protein